MKKKMMYILTIALMTVLYFNVQNVSAEETSSIDVNLKVEDAIEKGDNIKSTLDFKKELRTYSLYGRLQISYKYKSMDLIDTLRIYDSINLSKEEDIVVKSIKQELVRRHASIKKEDISLSDKDKYKDLNEYLNESIPFEKELKDNVEEIINYIDETEEKNKIEQENDSESFKRIVFVAIALSGVGLALYKMTNDKRKEKLNNE